MNINYGWSPTLPRKSDLKYLAPARSEEDPLPHKVDLRNDCPPVYNQYTLGSCTANAIASAIQFSRLKSKFDVNFEPSRLFIYYNERKLSKRENYDAGATLRDGLTTVSKQGCCSDMKWPYDITKFTIQPPQECYDEASLYTAINYYNISQDINHLKACLAEGFPFVFGFMVYDSFENVQVRKTGILDMPNEDVENFLGGHAVMAVGYDDDTKRFIIRNSWGDKWGDKGYFTMPYDYLTSKNYASDFWTIRIMSKMY